MIPSHFVEKLKIGKKYVLLDLVVHPDCERPWETAGPENKFIPPEVWKLIYQKLKSLCAKQFAERGGKSQSQEDTRCELDREYECRLEAKPGYLLKYEFKGESAKTVLNVVFNDEDVGLYRECLSVQIRDDSKALFRELRDKQRTIEKLQRENEKLREMPVAPSQEYTPAPVVKKSSLSSSSAASLEYIPTAINGGSPVLQTSSYKARKIESTIKPEPDPYTPTSSQEKSPEGISYVPTMRTPSRSISSPKPPIPDSVESLLAGKRRRRQKDIFGSEDEDEHAGGVSKLSPQKIKAEISHNRSDEDMFSPDPSPKPVDTMGSSGEELAATGAGALTDHHKRMQLPRKTKAGVSYGGLMTSPDEKSASPSTSSSVTKRRRKDEESGSKSKSSKTTLDGWIEKSSSASSSRKKDDGSHSAKDKENGKSHRKSKKKKDDTPAPEAPAAVPIRVDHEKLREDAEKMRKTIAAFDVLDKMFPEDKTLQDVPVLNFHDTPVEEIIATFDEYQYDLRLIYDRHKDKTSHQLIASDLCNFEQVTGVLTEDQTYAMIQHLERFNPDDQRGQYTEFFASTLVMEWGLRIWMDKYGYQDRKEALSRIKLQEEANPMDLTPTTLESMMGHRSRKR